MHRMDPRKKLLLLAAGSAAALGADPPAAGLLLLLIAAGFFVSRIPVSGILREGRMIWIFLGILFIAHAARNAPFWPAGAAAGAVAAARLFLIVLAGHLLSATTSAGALVAAAAWFLRPIPGIRHQRAALLAGLTLAFIPLIFEQAGQARDARLARCGDRDRSRIRRIVRTARPVLVRTLLRSGEIASALEARCYRDERTLPAFSSAPGEWPVFLPVFLILLGAGVLPVMFPGLLTG